MKVPCRDCTERSAICHVHCERYKVYADWVAERRERRLKESTRRAEYTQYIIERHRAREIRKNVPKP